MGKGRELEGIHCLNYYSTTITQSTTTITQTNPYSKLARVTFGDIKQEKFTQEK